ncbi:MAG TPA: hypothetical protein VLL25_04495 [Acidimicrobiales bacterium]|nr:hypothetical protein [Acidimicrobiales bacterium]
MAKVLKWALLGAGIGVALAAVNAYRRDEPVDALATKAVKLGAIGAAIGAMASLLRRRHALSVAKTVRSAQLLGSAVVAARPYLKRARPHVERAVEEIGSRLTRQHPATAAA